MTTSRPTPVEEEDLQFPRLIGTGISAKLLVDTSTQIFNPFLEIIAVGLGTNVIVLGRMLGLRSIMGLLAPLSGSLADRYGYRIVMRVTLVAAALGMFLIGISTNLWTVALGMMFSGYGISSFVPNLHAYLSAKLPYAIRARGLGMIEYSWALTGIIGLFLVGQIIAAVGWRAPFFMLAAGLVLMAVVIGILPAAGRATHRPAHGGAQVDVGPAARLRDFFRLGIHARSAYSLIVAGALNFFAAMQLMLMHGAWLGTEYGLGAAQLGTIALILGVFDLTASISVSLFTDRIGKRRSVIIGMSGALLGYLLMPFLNTGLVAAVAIIGFARGFFEFGVVSNFPLLSEQVPEQRGKVMTLSAAFAMIGATVASFSAPALYAQFGVTGMAGTSAVAEVGALLILVLVVNEHAANTA